MVREVVTVHAGDLVIAISILGAGIVLARDRIGSLARANLQDAEKRLAYQEKKIDTLRTEQHQLVAENAALKAKTDLSPIITAFQEHSTMVLKELHAISASQAEQATIMERIVDKLDTSDANGSM